MLTVYEPLYIFGLRSLCFIMQSFEIRVRIEGRAKHDFFFRCSHKLLHLVNYALMSCFCFSMDGSDLCFEVVRRATAGFVYSEAVAR